MCTLLWCVLLLASALAWDLSPLGMDSAVVTHVTLCGARTILCLARDSVNQQYTLAESIWPEMVKPFLSHTRPFPTREPQRLGNCIDIQTAISSDWDGLRHLFVLDAGWLDVCLPKILVYDLINNKKVVSSDLSSIPRTRLNSLVVDSSFPLGPRAYIGEPGPGSLIIFDLRSHRWWEVSLSQPPRPGNQPTSTFQLALAGSHLYSASDVTDTLFTMNLTALRASLSPPVAHGNSIADVTRESCPTEVEGTLLGPPIGLLGDARHGLYYCLPHDYACVRWDIQQPLVAENHEVLLQSAEILPHVRQLFLDWQKQLWALTDNINNTHCVRVKKPTLNYLW